ncbi:MAG: thermonuclease family protein [Hyphomonadaceae bacterium]
MAKSKRAIPAALVALFCAGLGALFLANDPTPRAQAQATQLVSADAPRGLRGRNQDMAARMRVIDGDTLEDMREDITYRVVNIDTPETGSRARCAAERALGDRATETVRALVNRAEHLELRATGRIDRYGRTIAFVLIDGSDLGETLIAAGLARRWRGRREPWCDAGGNLLP